MEDEELAQINNSSDSAPPSQSTTYQMLIRQSKKLGGVATKAFGDLKQLLNQEIILPPAADQLLDGLRTLRPRVREAKDKNLQRMIDLKHAVRKSHEVLASAQTFALFPDRVIMDRTKLTMIKRNFFWSSDVISIQIEDILNVSSSVGPIFGTLTVASRVMSTIDHFQIRFLWRSDAIDLKHIIQGYAIAKNSGIDISQFPKKVMLETLRELGHDSGT